MERLTYDCCVSGNHCWQVRGADNLTCKEVCVNQGDRGCDRCPIRIAIDRLAAYEETGLSPGEIGMSSGKNDRKGKPISTGDIVEFNNVYDFDCYGIVKFGEYDQDGSGGGYPPRKCLGFYVEVDTFTCPDGYEPENFPKYLEQQNLLEICDICEVIGNLVDNPELVGGSK